MISFEVLLIVVHEVLKIMLYVLYMFKKQLSHFIGSVV